MKIVFVTDLYYPAIGGIEVETHRLAHALADEGHSVSIIAPSKNAHDNVSKDGKVTIFDVVSFHTPFHKTIRIVPFGLAKRKVFKILKQIDPNVIHVQTNLPLAKTASIYAKKYQIACVATAHYADGEFENNIRNFKALAWFVDRINRKLFKEVYKNVDGITIPSGLSEQYFLRLIDNKAKLTVLSNGINLKKFNRNTSRKTHKNNIIFVGRLEPTKGVSTIIRALPKILSKVNVTLTIVGDGFEANNLVGLAKKENVLDKICFTGFANEEKVITEYSKASIFVTASTAENQPIVVLEAMASGLPVVATQVGGIPELVHNGKNGYLFNPGDSDTLADHVIKILTDTKLQKHMGQESLRIIKDHDIAEVAGKIQSLYQQVIFDKQNRVYSAPFYLTRSFAVKVSLAILLMGILFRNSLLSPSTARAKNLAFKNKIMNLKIVKKIENLDLKFKNQIPYTLIKK